MGMWIVVTAKINDTKTRMMRINMDYVASYGPAESAPCMIIGSDGSAYPIAETPEQIDAIVEPLGAHRLNKRKK